MKVEKKICVVGLGYVGLPLLVNLRANYFAVGVDINAGKIKDLKSGVDLTKELDTGELQVVKNCQLFSDFDSAVVKDCNFYIVTVPTPLTSDKQPDLEPLRSAASSLADILKSGDFIVFESTVYPGCIREQLVPILEKGSQLLMARSDSEFLEDGFFSVGYSPERINPGDRSRRLRDIVKVVAGSCPAASRVLEELYGSVIPAGIHVTPSIEVAEAAKVIENTQRDLNIAFINELSMIFDRVGISTMEVIAAASTKWNFVPMSPGLVGGHCIGVDPYYLTSKAQSLGHHPEVILAGRRINDGMAKYVAHRIMKGLMLARQESGRDCLSATPQGVLLLGGSFKENCPDSRNSKVFDVVDELMSWGVSVVIFDPLIDADDQLREKYCLIKSLDETAKFDGLGIMVPHTEFSAELVSSLISKMMRCRYVFDLKSLFSPSFYESHSATVDYL